MRLTKPNRLIMAISQRVKDLTAIALQDRIITYKERQTIMKAALKDGASKNEINAYINEALEIRLKSYKKEELSSCPGCGHGVPLITNECPYCGRWLEHQDNVQIVPPQYRVTGEDADAIRDENARTAESKKKTCPRCGAPYPLVSNICSYCKYILHEQVGSDFNISQLLDNIQESIDSLKKTTRPSLGSVLKFRCGLLCLYLAAVLLICAGMYDSTAFFGLSCIALVAAYCLTIFLNAGREFPGVSSSWKTPTDKTPMASGTPLQRGILYYAFEVQTIKSPIDLADDEFYLAFHNSEKYRRQIDLLYGDDQDHEAERLLAKLNVEIDGYKKARVKGRTQLLALLLGLLAIPFVFQLLKPSPVKEFQMERYEHPGVYLMADYSKELKYEQYSRNAVPEFFKVDKNAKLKIDVINNREEKGKYQYQLRISSVDLVSSGKISAQPDTFHLRAALISEDWNVVGAEYLPINAVIRQENDNYQTLFGKGSGHVYVDFVSSIITNSPNRLKEIADSAYYFMIF